MIKKEPKIEYEPEVEQTSLKQKSTKDIKQKLKACEKEKREYLEGWQRAKADLVNYRQRQEKQLQDWQKMINEGLILELLPVLDTLDAAIANSKQKEKEGYMMIKNGLEGILKKHGLEKIDCQKACFDSSLHEAVECSPPQDKQKDGDITGEIACGYKLNGKVIRTAKVKVIKK